MSFRWPLARPLLPTIDHIARYARKSDVTRIYTNAGPLLREFEARLADHFGVSPASVVALANCTAALTLSLRAQDILPGQTCLVPSWTFVATVNAATSAGLRPQFVDIDPGNWAIQPTGMAAPRPDKMCHAIPVAPFGAPIDVDDWADHASDTGGRVVIDAAAAFDSVSGMVHPSGMPVAISFHATKAFGIGEGGCVVTADTGLAERVRTMANHGLSKDRTPVTDGTNAKLSELQAAVGLAALDKWPDRRATWQRLSEMYRHALNDVDHVSCQPGFGDGWVSSYCCVELDADAATVVERLAARGIQGRKWWGDGAHHRFAAAHPADADLIETRRLASRAVCLPFYVDMTEEDVQNVVSGLREALADAASLSIAS